MFLFLINPASGDGHQELHVGLEDEGLPLGLGQGALLHRPDVGGVEEAPHDDLHGRDLQLLEGGDTQRACEWWIIVNLKFVSQAFFSHELTVCLVFGEKWCLTFFDFSQSKYCVLYQYFLIL